ncbi:hypothetical protein Q8F55_007763 [Vanrija albida]|uniref:Uncharacterized protein n=1 Tax=Vanrija albida TaxID=181172 RepID=A0ABR3PUE5_9TREE
MFPGRAPSGVTSVLLHRPPIATGLTASSTTDPRPAVPRGYVGNRLPIPVDNLPATKPFSFDTPNISAAEIGVPKAYNAEYPHPLTAYASPAVNASTVSTSGYDELLSELLDNDPGAAMGSILANSGKEGIGPPALSLRPGAEDGCGIPENLWLQLTTWASVKVPVGAVVPMSHPSRFNPGPRFAAMPDRSRKVLPPVAARQHIGTEPSPSSDVSSLRRSLSTGDLDTFLRSWSELATATRLADGHRRSSFPNSDYSPPFYRQGHLASQSPLDLPSTSQFRPRMSLPFNLLSPVAEEETPPPTGASVEQRSPFPSPFNHGGFLADTDTPKDPTEFIPSVWDEPRDPDASSYLAATPLTPPLDWPMERHEEKPPWVIERYEEKSPDGRHEQPQHTSHIHFPAVLLPSDDEWAPATTTLDFSTGNSIWV